MPQQSLDLPVTDIDLMEFVQFEPSVVPVEDGTRWRVGGEKGRRVSEVGLSMGTLSLTVGSGHGVLLQFPDGKIEAFAPMALFLAPA